MLASRRSLALVIAPLLGGCAGGGIARAPIVTDRPSFTEGTATLPAGAVQAEAGYTYTHDEGVGTHAVGELLARVAAGGRTELRLGVNSYRVLSVDGERRGGIEDASVGAKVALLDAADYFDLRRPALSVIVATAIPTGSRAVAERAWQPVVKLLAGWPITGSLALTSNLDYTYASANGGRFGQGALSASLGYAATDRLGGWVEYFRIVPASRGGDGAGYVDAGVTYLMATDLQLDARVGTGRDGAGRGAFVGIGLARRW